MLLQAKTRRVGMKADRVESLSPAMALPSTTAVGKKQQYGNYWN